MWVLIDNYDSFTHILHHYLLMAGSECLVYRNDEVTLEEIIALSPSRIIISPGPETPLHAGITMEVIAYFHDKIPILGVCLGHQAIGMFFGAKLAHSSVPVHGKVSLITHTATSIFEHISSPMPVMRYHSLAIYNVAGTGLEILAQTADGTIMAFRHRKFPCIGVQFHPESIGTTNGQELITNWAHQAFSFK